MLQPEGRGFDSQLFNPSCCSVALGSTQPLTEMSSWNFQRSGGGGGKKRQLQKAKYSTSIFELNV
jgi:hypothetical protein